MMFFFEKVISWKIIDLLYIIISKTRLFTRRTVMRRVLAGISSH